METRAGTGVADHTRDALNVVDVRVREQDRVQAKLAGFQNANHVGRRAARIDRNGVACLLLPCDVRVLLEPRGGKRLDVQTGSSGMMIGAAKLRGFPIPSQRVSVCACWIESVPITATIST